MENCLEINSCLGLILAGGKSTRMGQNKEGLNRQGQTMLDYSKSLLMQLGISPQVSGGAEGVKDIVADGGPLAGIYTLLQQNQPLKPKAVLVVPVDMPLLKAATLQQLIEKGQANARATCFQDYYLPLYLPVDHKLLDYLQQVFISQTIRQKSVKALLAALNGQQIVCEHEEELINANTPEEWQQAMGKLPSEP